MTKIYGIKNCSTVKKALNWLDENSVQYEFHDYKKAGADEKKLRNWVKKFGLETIMNSKGMTFRNLEESQKPKNEEEAITLMLEKTSIIKRPILEKDENQIIGFDEQEYSKLL